MKQATGQPMRRQRVTQREQPLTLEHRLRALIEVAPAGTLVPVESLAVLLADAQGVPGDEHAPEAPEAGYTVAEVAAKLNRSASTVRGWCVAREIEGAYRLNGREWRIPQGALKAYLNRQQQRPAAQSLRTPRRGRPPDLGAWRKYRPAS